MSALMASPQWTDGEDRFRLTGLDPGPLLFEVWFANRSRIRRQMTLHSGINSVEVRLPSAATPGRLARPADATSVGKGAGSSRPAAQDSGDRRPAWCH